MRERLIGIDAGGTMTKAAMFDLAGREIGCERRANVTSFPEPGQTERDPDTMWRAACGAVRDLLAKTETSPDDVAAMGATGYGSGLFLVDRAGDPVRPGIGSTDTRAAGLVADWEAKGLATPVSERISQRVWAGQSLALLGWLARHEPEVLARAHRVVLCKDFLRGRLCGDLSTDPTDAGISGLFDVRSGRPAAEIFEWLGLSAWLQKVPEVRPSCEIVGRLTDAAALQTGLRAGTPIIEGLVDVSASAFASGVVEPSRISVVAGTFSINSTLHQRPRTSTLPFLQCAAPFGDSFLATEGGATSASNFEWICRHFFDTEGLRAACDDRGIYGACNDLVAAAMQRRNNIFFLPFLFGGPGGAPAGLIGMSADNTLGDVLRGVYEGVAFAHKRDIDILLSGPDASRPQVARLAGGASRSAIWAQIFADTLDLPVEIMDGSEMGAKGVALAAAVAIGAYPDLHAAAGGMTRIARRIEPRPERAAVLADKYSRYLALCAALSPVRPVERAAA